MLRNFLAILSLQAFQVSNRRKGVFLVSVMAFVAVWYLRHMQITDAYISPQFSALALVFLGSAVAAGVIRLFVITTYRQRSKIPVGEHDNFILGIDALSVILVAFAVLGSIFPIFDIPFTKFITSISVFSVAIAWLFKEYITNFIDSFRLMFSRDFLVGDYIKVGESSKGVITDITFRATKVKTDEGDMLFVPNSNLMNSEVVNYSKTHFKRIIVPFTAPTAQLINLSLLETRIQEALLAEFPELITPEKTYFRIIKITNGYTECAYEVAIDTYSFAIEDSISRTVNCTVIAHTERG